MQFIQNILITLAKMVSRMFPLYKNTQGEEIEGHPTGLAQYVVMLTNTCTAIKNCSSFCNAYVETLVCSLMRCMLKSFYSVRMIRVRLHTFIAR